ncbi:MAG: NUDIX domain-containing protein [Vicinamibacterales bacterium]
MGTAPHTFVFDRVDDMSRGTDRVAAIALLRRDGAALMQLRDDKPGLSHANMWVLPGGHSEPDEPIESTARREFLEETEYRLGDLHWLARFEDQPPDHPLFSVAVFWAVYDDVQPIVCHEGQALEFLKREDADRYAVPDFLIRAWDLALGAARQAGAIV